MESQSDTTQAVSELKLPVLKTGEYDLWSMRMEQYLTFTDHDLWEVIVNGDLVSPIASASAGAEGPIPPKTHLLKFHACKDVTSLWEAIKNRFGGNKESKKMQKTILKQNYENFVASSQEGLDKTYDRFQKLISQLEIHGEVISQEDVNLKLLRSLPSAWNNIALIMRNKSDLDTLSMDDLYYNLKVYESEIKGQTSSSLNSHNVAFISSDNSSITNETVNIVHSVSAVSSKDQASTASYVDDKWISNVKRILVLTRQKVECLPTAMESSFFQRLRAPRTSGDRNSEDPRRNAPMGHIYDKKMPWVVQDGIGLRTLSAKDKTDLGYDSQINESELNNIHMNESEVVHSVFNSRESDVDDSPINDRFKTGEGFHVVPPPYIGNYMPPRPDLSFAGLDEFVFQSAVRKTTTTVPETETSISKTCKDIIEKLNLLNNKGRVTSQREIRPVWNNAQRVNRQNKFTHPHPKRKFVPTAILTKSGKVPVNAVKQSSPRAATLISTARPVITAAPKSKVNDALPKTPKAVVSAAKGNGENVVKSSACWIWRPTGNVIDHTSKDSGSYMLKIFDYVDLQGKLNFAIQIAANLVFHEKTKHFDIGLYLIREIVSSGVIKTLKVASANNDADIFTKGLRFDLNNPILSLKSSSLSLVHIDILLQDHLDLVLHSFEDNTLSLVLYCPSLSSSFSPSPSPSPSPFRQTYPSCDGVKAGVFEIVFVMVKVKTRESENAIAGSLGERAKG
ncbi:hypothetical protein Tco_0053984 [Tanacetum coccineum]